MCGIAGYSHIHRRQNRSDLERSLASIAHRGPDQQGVFYSGFLSMGARRLRVVDIELGDQPFSSPDGDITLVFNGEIFNHAELRSELESVGYTFRSRCDTEVLLNAFHYWGNAAFERVRSMFAAGFWIRSERRLVLARDRMGIKPLYYCTQDGEIYFGSEMKCIFAHPVIRRHLSVEGLNCYLSLNYIPSPYTMVDGIFKLMPGHLLEWQGGEAKLHSYLTPRFTERAAKTLDEAADELDTLMRQSVTEQMNADVPLGIWLSGGLDSSTILHYASAVSAKPLHTLSITFNGRSFDDGTFDSREELRRDETLCSVRVPKNRHNEATLRRDIRRVSRNQCSKFAKRLGFAARAVIDRELITTIQQIACHGKSQPSKPDPPNPIAHSSFFLVYKHTVDVYVTFESEYPLSGLLSS